jgi:hypothetical protein
LAQWEYGSLIHHGFVEADFDFKSTMIWGIFFVNIFEFWGTPFLQIQDI